MLECLPSVRNALILIPSPARKQKNRGHAHKVHITVVAVSIIGSPFLNVTVLSPKARLVPSCLFVISITNSSVLGKLHGLRKSKGLPHLLGTLEDSSPGSFFTIFLSFWRQNSPIWLKLTQSKFMNGVGWLSVWRAGEVLASRSPISFKPQPVSPARGRFL